ncbi:MAG TPA: hypothetical protein VN714_13480 [Trebonia sp.]|nr:hypothetical protein [Trebonia sp.]
METRPTGIYQVPWRSPRPANGQGPLRTPQPPVARPRRALPPPNRSLPAARRGFSDTPRNSPDAHGGAPDAPWPTLIRQAPRRIRVVGPIEALRSPASNLPAAPRGPVAGPAATQRPVARPEAGQRPAVVAPTDARRGRPGNTGVDVPRGGVPAPLSGSSTGWQLAQRAWEDSGAAWEAPAADSDDWYSAGLPTPDPYYPDYPGDYPTDYPGGLPEPDPDDLFDPHPTRPDLPVLGDLAESRVGIGPWPVQTPPEAPQPVPIASAPLPTSALAPTSAPAPAESRAQREPQPEPETEDRELNGRPSVAPTLVDPPRGGHQPAPQDARDQPRDGSRGQLPDGPSPSGSADPELPPVTPQLSRRIRRATAVWSDHPVSSPGQVSADGRAGQAPPLPPPASVPSSPFTTSGFAPASPFAPSPAFAAPRSYGSSRAYDDPPTFPGSQPGGEHDSYDDRQSYGPASALDAPPGFAFTPLSAPVAPPLSEPDELFRAWQGSVDEAAGRRAPRAARRPVPVSVGRSGARGRGWQVAKIGVPAAVIVTVGAGALMMLTGRANEMLADRASSGALSSGKPTSGPVASGQTSVGPSSLTRTSTLTLAGYPAQHGTVGVAAMWSAGGTTMAVGYADGHPAVWRHAADGSWTLVSAAVLGGVTGHLTSVAQGPSGWIAVGSVQANGTAEPAVFASADGIAWQQVTALTALASGDAQFLSVAAGHGGYLVVGKQGTGNQQAVALWWSADLKNWVNGASSRPPGSVATSAVATTAGFVAVGSENGCHTFWTSGDGQHWTAHDLAKPNGATAATLTSVAAGQGGQSDRFVAAGVATTGAGDLPIVVTAANDGTHISQTVLSSASGPAATTAVTATASGFLAVGTAGQANAHHAVTWTSTEGRIWTPAAPLQAAGNSEITALATPSTGTTLTATAQQGANPAIFTFAAP